MSELTILGIAITLLLMVVAVYRFVERVFLRDEPPHVVGSDEKLDQIDALAARRALLIREIKDIEFDYELGKIDETDYRRLRRRYQRRWLNVDRALEEAAGLNDTYLAAVEAQLEARLSAVDAQEARTPRRDRQVCPSCAAANPLGIAHCLECDASLPDAIERGVPTPAPAT